MADYRGRPIRAADRAGSDQPRVPWTSCWAHDVRQDGPDYCALKSTVSARWPPALRLDLGRRRSRIDPYSDVAERVIRSPSKLAVCQGRVSTLWTLSYLSLEVPLTQASNLVAGLERRGIHSRPLHMPIPHKRCPAA